MKNTLIYNIMINKFLKNYWYYIWIFPKNRIKNLYRWFPVIWKDRDWDHTYILDILKAKLQFTRQFYLDGEHWQVEESANQIIKEISLAIRIIEQLDHDDIYHFEYQKHLGEGRFKNIEDDLELPYSYESPGKDIMKKQNKHEEDWNRLNWHRLFCLFSKKFNTWWD